MKQPFLFSENCINPEALRTLRKEKEMSQDELAKLAGVSRSTIGQIEAQDQSTPNESLRRQNATNIENIALILGVQLEKEQTPSILRLTERLKGTWFGWHLSRCNKLDSVELIETKWVISSQHNVQLEYTSEGSSLTYKGTFVQEAPGRIIFKLNTDEELQEHTIWRFPYPVGRNFLELEGHWMGVDFGQKTITGPIILSKEKEISRRTAYKRLSESPNHSLRIKLSERDTSVRWEERWLERPIEDAMERIQSGGEIRMLTTYYPNNAWLQYQMSQLIKHARENNLKDISVKMLLGNPGNKPMLTARTHLMVDTAIDNFIGNIRFQAEQLRKWNDTTERIFFEVRYHNQWFSSMSFCVGNHFLCAGLLFGHTSAENGPTMIFNDPTSRTWRLFDEEFKTLWKASEAKEHEIQLPAAWSELVG